MKTFNNGENALFRFLFLSRISHKKQKIFYRGKFKTVKVGADRKKDGN